MTNIVFVNVKCSKCQLRYPGIKYSTCIYEYVFLNDDFPVMNTVLVSYIVISRNLVSSKHGNVLQLLEFCRVFGKAKE